LAQAAPADFACRGLCNISAAIGPGGYKSTDGRRDFWRYQLFIFGNIRGDTNRPSRRAGLHPCPFCGSMVPSQIRAVQGRELAALLVGAPSDYLNRDAAFPQQDRLAFKI